MNISHVFTTCYQLSSKNVKYLGNAEGMQKYVISQILISASMSFYIHILISSKNLKLFLWFLLLPTVIAEGKFVQFLFLYTYSYHGLGLCTKVRRVGSDTFCDPFI